MIERPFWIQRIEEAWRVAPIVWLAGVRRIGKTTLAKSLGEGLILYLNCDLPVVEEMVAQPEMFFRNCDRLDIFVVNPRQWLDRFADPTR
jgi:predicted AAA+ superfamily ATPase